jgi:O-methyltransferase involved in polyketide biosynthesis
MPTADAVKLGSVQQTLLLPLWGRAIESQKARPMLIDGEAVRIIQSIPYDFSQIAAKTSFVSQLAWIVRSLHIDRATRAFLGRHPAAIVANLGCGLDTTYERVDNGAVTWYDIDLPDVIELRNAYLQPTSRRKFVSCSILEDGWVQDLKGRSPVLFIAAGVLYYFEENQVRTLLHKLADRFPGGELVFDACSPQGLKIANQRVIEDTGMSSDARLKWGLNRAAELHTWDSRITVLAEYPLFRGMKSGLSLREKWGTFLSDTLRIMSMVHLRFETSG